MLNHWCLCLLQLHFFACTVTIRPIYCTTVQMLSGHYSRSLHLLLEKGLLICHVHYPLKHVNSEDDLWSLIHCCVVIICTVVTFVVFLLNVTVKPCH